MTNSKRIAQKDGPGDSFPDLRGLIMEIYGSTSGNRKNVI